MTTGWIDNVGVKSQGGKSMTDRPRVRDVGIEIGRLPTGRLNAITDVAGVQVGHTTLISGEGPLQPGEGPVRTGVTVILPHDGNLFRQKVVAAVHTINGFGKICGFEEIRELGVIETPIALTNTLNVYRVADALAQAAVRQSPEIGVRTSSVNAVVGETNDGYLNDLQGRHVNAEHVWAAMESASGGPVAEGAVGAGTGTSCFGWKGGIGTASRVWSEGFTVGALVQTNFGRPENLRVDGVPVGRQIKRPQDVHRPAAGESVMVVLATDAPLTSRQLRRLCVRAAAGLARTGSDFGHGSGDFVIAFTTRCALADEGRAMFWLLPAVAECVEEAVLNSLFRAEPVVGRDGHTRHALPVDRVAALVESDADERG
jgi:D-aminopeptidase